MSRNLVYVNGQNESVTFETGPYLIVKIEGLGIPNIDRQEQKAPYQDGTTYIDSLLQNRDIVVELAITKPNDFASIALYRRQLSQRLCPKYGLGTLTYTDEDGNAYNIRAVVSSMVFPNKDFRDPYMRAMVTFTACDPYWKDVTEDSISLPTSVTSAPATINAAQSNYPNAIFLHDGSIFLAYIRVSDGYLVSRRFNNNSWSAESVINPEASLLPSCAQLDNGDIVVAYISNVSVSLVMRTFTSTWSAASLINSGSMFDSHSLIKLNNNNLFIAYRRNGDGYLVSRTFVSSWGAEQLIISGSYGNVSVIQQSSGDLFLACIAIGTAYLYYSVFSNSWSTPELINPAASAFPSLAIENKNTVFVAYRRTSDKYIIKRSFINGQWTDGSVMSDVASEVPTSAYYYSIGLFIAYIRLSDSYLLSVTRSVTPVPAVITGDVPSPFLVTFNGPSVNPRIINQNTLEYIRLNTTLAASDSFEVDTSFGNKTVKLLQGGIVKNGIAFLDIGSTFFQLERGTNTVYYEDDAVLSTATATMEWTERYVGL